MSAYSIGVDLGGTNLRVAATDQSGLILARVSVPAMYGGGPEKLIEDIARIISTVGPFKAAPLMRTAPDDARRILAEGLALHPESASLYYNLACLEAVTGDPDAAMTALRRAIELRPPAAEWARDDEDLASLRSREDFVALVSR